MVVVADVEAGARLAGNEIDGRIADVDRGEFQVRRRELRAAVVERRLQRGDECNKTADRIVGAIRIGDVALPAGDDQRAIERAAAAGLDGVAEHFDIARLAKDAMVEFFAALGRPLQQLDGAVDRDALLVAGDEQRDRTPLRLAAVSLQMIHRCGDEAGNAAFHIDRAAAVQHVVSDFAGERRMPPRRFIAGRHHVGMAGKYQIGFFAADAGIKIIDGRCARLGERHAMHGEAGLRQHALQIGQRAAVLRRYRAAADRIAGDGDGIGGHAQEHRARHAPVNSRRSTVRRPARLSGSGPKRLYPEVPRRQPISTKPQMTRAKPPRMKSRSPRYDHSADMPTVSAAAQKMNPPIRTNTNGPK